MSLLKISKPECRKYILHGGFPTVTRQVHTWTLKFLNYIDLSAVQHGWFPSPRRGPAQATLQYVSDQLWEIYEDANEQRDLLLQSYTFLHDLKRKQWVEPRATEALWTFFQPSCQLLGQVEEESSNSESEDVTTEAPSPSPPSSQNPKCCGHCQSHTLHQKVRPKIGHGKRHCPWKDETYKVACKARALLNMHAAANEIKTFDAEILKEFGDKAKAALN